MTLEQYERWKDFAIRMAKTCFKGQRKPGPRHIIACVEEFFADIEDGCGWIDLSSIGAVCDWDHSDPYPAGSTHYGREYHQSWCGCDGYRFKNDNKPNPECEECHGTGLHYALLKPYGVGDAITDCYEERWMPDYWHQENESAWERRRDRWCNDARCCIRAGLDLASAPSGGVLGFTAGDLRRMYPEGVPDWVSCGDERWSHWPSGELNGTFGGMADDIQLVL